MARQTARTTQELAQALGSNLTPLPTADKKPKVALSATKCIILEENDNIPANGLFLGLNGRSYILQPGVEADVPRGLIEILDHAVESRPTVDPLTRRITGYRDRLRYPYRVVEREAA